MTLFELQAQIDALSERYACRLTDAQHAAFWRWYDASPDAALVWLERAIAALPPNAPDLDALESVGLSADSHIPHERGVCLDCAGPCSRTSRRCLACDRAAVHTRHAAKVTCPGCGGTKSPKSITCRGCADPRAGAHRSWESRRARLEAA